MVASDRKHARVQTSGAHVIGDVGIEFGQFSAAAEIGMTMQVDGYGFAGKLGGFGDKACFPPETIEERRRGVSGCCTAEHR